LDSALTMRRRTEADIYLEAQVAGVEEIPAVRRHASQ
jgi:hypothetical protein